MNAKSLISANIACAARDALAVGKDYEEAADVLLKSLFKTAPTDDMVLHLVKTALMASIRSAASIQRSNVKREAMKAIVGGSSSADILEAYYSGNKLGDMKLGDADKFAKTEQAMADGHSHMAIFFTKIAGSGDHAKKVRDVVTPNDALVMYRSSAP